MVFVCLFVCRNGSIEHPGLFFTFGTSRESVYSRQVAYLGQGAYLFFEKQPNVQNKTLMRYSFKKIGAITNITVIYVEYSVKVTESISTPIPLAVSLTIHQYVNKSFLVWHLRRPIR